MRDSQKIKLKAWKKQSWERNLPSFNVLVHLLCTTWLWLIISLGNHQEERQTMHVDCAIIHHTYPMKWTQRNPLRGLRLFLMGWLAGLGSKLTLKLGLDWVRVNLILELPTHQMIPIDFDQGLTNDQFNAAPQQKLRTTEENSSNPICDDW